MCSSAAWADQAQHLEELPGTFPWSIRQLCLIFCSKIKAESIVASSFNEVLYLDSDNIPLTDPAHLFGSELYAGKNQPGVVFWSDLNKDHRKCWFACVCISRTRRF